MKEEDIAPLALKAWRSMGYRENDAVEATKITELCSRFLVAVRQEESKEAVDAVLLDDMVDGHHPQYGSGLFATQMIVDLQAKVAQLSDELRDIDAALDDPRVNTTITTVDAVKELKTKVAWL